jgi:hypothetical protein
MPIRRLPSREFSKRLRRDVAAEMRAVEIDFSLLPVAAGVPPAVEPVRPARRIQPFARTGSLEDLNVVEKFGRFFPGGGTLALYGRRDARRYSGISRLPRVRLPDSFPSCLNPECHPSHWLPGFIFAANFRT